MSLTSPASPIDLFRTFSLETQKGQPVDPKKVVQLAQEFEAMLMLQMVRQMRQSITFDGEKEQGFGNETMTDTFDIELSRYLAQSGGVGLGGMIQRQLSKETQGASTDAPATDTSAATDTSTKAPAASEIPTPLPSTVVVGTSGSRTGGSPAGGSGTSGRPASGSPASGSPASGSPGSGSGTSGSNASGTSTSGSSTSAAALTMPLDSATTSAFGWRKDPLGQERRFHSGVDLRAAYGTEVPAAAGGQVIFAGDRGGYGTMVVIRHDDGFDTRYAHLSSMAVRVGDRVEAGHAIGRVGSSGRSAGPHLHFEVIRNGQQLDPTQVTGSRAAEFKFVSGVDDSLQERVPSSTLVLLDGPTDVVGADDEDSGREAR
jgi:murein DD-endopeptidase MepM/ murein hydrolase activator NlpD